MPVPGWTRRVRADQRRLPGHHPGALRPPAGAAAAHFQHRSDEIQAVLATAFEGYLIIEGILAPPNVSELIASPGIALGEFERLTLVAGQRHSRLRYVRGVSVSADC